MTTNKQAFTGSSTVAAAALFALVVGSASGNPAVTSSGAACLILAADHRMLFGLGKSFVRRIEGRVTPTRSRTASLGRGSFSNPDPFFCSQAKEQSDG